MTGVELTREQEARLVHTLEQDPDMWLVLLTLYLTSQGKKSEELKLGLLNNTHRWQSLARDVKQWGFGDLADQARAQTAQWNASIEHLFEDPGQANLLSFYLKSLITLKAKRVTDVGLRAQARERLYAVQAAMANDALTSLEKFRIAAQRLAGDKPLTEQARAYYQAAQRENALRAAALLGASLQLREAKLTNDIRQLQRFIQHNLIEPLESQAATLTGPDKKKALDKAASYRRLRQAVEINFE